MKHIILAAIVALTASVAQAETLRVASPQKGSWENSAPDWGSRLGYFKELGLDLDVIYTNGGAESQQGVISGSIDIAAGAGVLGVLGAQAKGAPLVMISNSYIGTTDSYWYVRADSPIQSLKDATGKTIGFSVPGSSTNLTVLSLLRAAGVKGARPTPTGNPVATLTQVMSGQIDIGWAVTPFLANELDRKEVRIIARGGDAPDLTDQSIRVTIASKQALAEKRDAIRRFMVGMRRTFDWMYSDDPRVVQWYAEGAGVTPAQAKRARDEFDPKSAVMPGPVRRLDVAVQQGLEFHYLRAPLSDAQLASFQDIMDGTQTK
jgi:NitT/TauT family transport system substrate-binding protein